MVNIYFKILLHNQWADNYETWYVELGTGDHYCWEHSGSVVECLTQERGAGGLSLTGVTALWSLSKTHLSWLSTGSTQEDLSLFN